MIIVFGSINFDYNFALDRFPKPGETILSDQHILSYGGKGANQAVSAARLGAKVALVGAVGTDETTNRMLINLRQSGVVTSGVAKSDNPTGVAMVMRNEDTGENMIIVSPGANKDAKADQIPDEILKPGNILLMQMEASPTENWKAAKRARQLNVTTVLNACPLKDISEDLLKEIDYVLVNEHEATELCKKLKLVSDKEKLKTLNEHEAAILIAKKLKNNVILTLGAKGSLTLTKDKTMYFVPSLDIPNIVDTTGAGDAFTGMFVAGLYAQMETKDALKRASIAGSLACTKQGTHTAYPFMQDIEDKLDDLGEIKEMPY